MKNIAVSLTISSCLLLSPAGMVFANDPHKATGVQGEPGSGAAAFGGAPISCQHLSPPPGVTVTPGNTATNPNSPFGNPSKVYAGAGAGNSGQGGTNLHPNSNYDVACFQQLQHQLP
jgi:hypothetical protein